MIEAVGHEHLRDFFRVCGERLAPGRRDAAPGDHDPRPATTRRHTRSVDFIKRYIFPGGELVSVGAVDGPRQRAPTCASSHLEDLTPHYAETLRRWRRRMLENLPRMRALGLGERFLRMWEFYLCYCEAGFEERQIGVVQALLEKPGAGARRSSAPSDHTTRSIPPHHGTRSHTRATRRPRKDRSSPRSRLTADTPPDQSDYGSNGGRSR